MDKYNNNLFNFNLFHSFDSDINSFSSIKKIKEKDLDESNDKDDETALLFINELFSKPCKYGSCDHDWLKQTANNISKMYNNNNK